MNNKCHPCTDAANAQRFAAYHGHDVINIDGIDWFHFNGSYWEPAEQYVQRCALELGSRIREESIERARAASDINLPSITRNAAQEEAEALLKFAKRSESNTLIASNPHFCLGMSNINRDLNNSQ